MAVVVDVVGAELFLIMAAARLLVPRDPASLAMAPKSSRISCSPSKVSNNKD